MISTILLVYYALAWFTLGIGTKQKGCRNYLSIGQVLLLLALWPVILIYIIWDLLDNIEFRIYHD